MPFVKAKAAAAVVCREETIVLPTWSPLAPDPNPMFLEKRVYQGSSGAVYPNPITDQIESIPSPREFRAIFLENDYVQLMLLPEIGGRIHTGTDKSTGYDFFYRQRVIKPALVGLLGPWISGGVEFNWPQHHRPSTFMPVHAAVEHDDEGGCTVWLSEHDPMLRMKGMAGVHLSAQSSVVEVRVRLYNRTPFTQTFLWWANVAVRVHEEYEVFFPPDVAFVADHARRAMSTFPLATGTYYGVNYSPGTDLRWYKNIPVPTSYMVPSSDYDFFGGYDHRADAGVVHVSNHHIAPGKKLWTWGCGEFGKAWDRNLTEEDGPYVELMAGAYTDNQPDFSWIAPCETRTFRQSWYPIHKIGTPDIANLHAAVSLRPGQRGLRLGILTTEPRSITIHLEDGTGTLLQVSGEVSPAEPAFYDTGEERECIDGLVLTVRDVGGEVLLEHRFAAPRAAEAPGVAREEASAPTLAPAPEPAREPPLPAEVRSTEELYLIGLHVEQNRHATRSAEEWWLEGLRRDPEDVRINHALGLSRLRRGLLVEAEDCFRAAIRRLTRLNLNPRDGEVFYSLGLTLQFQGRMEEAYAAHSKAAWNRAWQGPAYYALACISVGGGLWKRALEEVGLSLAAEPNNLKARALKAFALHGLDGCAAAVDALEESLRDDPLDFLGMAALALLSGSRDAWERYRTALGRDLQTHVDVLLDLAWCGLRGYAIELGLRFVEDPDLQSPMIGYLLEFLLRRQGEFEQATIHAERADAMDTRCCFPSRLEEMCILEDHLRQAPDSASANYLLGNALYHYRRYEEAMARWRTAARSSKASATVFRNLALGEYNVLHRAEVADELYAESFRREPSDARVFYEWDQLRKRALLASAEQRLQRLSEYPQLVEQRDDLSLEFLTLLNELGRWPEALERLLARRFRPWEGGEGLVSAQYVHAQRSLGLAALAVGDSERALDHFRQARCYPESLGEGKHLLTEERDLDYYSGCAEVLRGEAAAAEAFWRDAGKPLASPGYSTLFQALALHRLGDRTAAGGAVEALRVHLEELGRAPVRIDYFATSLPNLLLFDEDMERRRRADCTWLRALIALGEGDAEGAILRLGEVLQESPNHLPALDMRSRLQKEANFRAMVVLL